MFNKRSNLIIRVENGCAVFDISTKRYPDVSTVIDEADLAFVNDGKGRWIAANTKKERTALYVMRGVGGRKARKYELLHRVILGLTDRATLGDHRDGDSLNNRRNNLRSATYIQNAQNSTRRANGTSTYRGVSWDRERSKWTASIKKQTGGREALGRFKSELDAARAYDAAAHARYGAFAKLNYPEASRGL